MNFRAVLWTSEQVCELQSRSVNIRAGVQSMSANFSVNLLEGLEFSWSFPETLHDFPEIRRFRRKPQIFQEVYRIILKYVEYFKYSQNFSDVRRMFLKFADFPEVFRCFLKFADCFRSSKNFREVRRCPWSSQNFPKISRLYWNLHNLYDVHRIFLNFVKIFKAS